jgi:hypothetical protein
MKTTKAVLIIVATAVAQWLAPLPAPAQELYRAYVNVVGVETNQAGGLAHHTLRNWDFIHACAAEHGITNLMGLSLVYDRTANALEVVSGTNHTLLCTPLSFGGGVTVGNTNHTRFERLEWVTVDGGTNAQGTFAATEWYRYATNGQISAFSLTGRLQYADPAAGTNGATIYTGTVLAGSGFFDRDRDRDDDDRD